MHDWQLVSVGTLCDVGVATLQTGPFGSQLHAHDYVEEGIAVVPTEAIRDRQIDHTVLPKVTPSKAQELDKHRLIVGDILFARRGVQATGHIGVIREAEQGFLCGTGAIRLRIAPNNQLVLSDFLSHVLANPASVAWFKFHAIGATMPNLNEGIIRAFSFGLPSLKQQFAITHLLSAFDDKIDLNRRMNATLEAMAWAIFKDWFVDFGPTRAKMRARAPYLASEIWSLFPDRLDEEGKPDGWVSQPLSAFVELVGGGTPKTDKPEFWGGDTPWFSVGDAPTSSDVFVTETEKAITQEGLASCSARLLPKGATIITARGTVGKLAVAGRPMTSNQSCYGVLGHGSIPPQFVYFLLRDAILRLQANTHGSVFDTITRATFSSVSAIRSRDAVMISFGQLVKPLMDRILANVEESRTLAATRDLLLPKLMSGELQVKGAEKMLEVTA